MAENERFLLVITKNKSSVVLESPNAISMDRLQSQAEVNGAVCKRVSIDQFYPKYRGYRYFDLRNPITRETFSMDEILEILDGPLEAHGEAEDLFGGNIFH